MTRFGPDVVAAVCRHMDDDHADDGLLIVQVLGGLPSATAVRAVDVDGEGMTFRATTPDGVRDARIAFGAPVTERPQLRLAVVELHDRARREAGLPLQDAEH